MVSLSPACRSKLYECITDALRAAQDECCKDIQTTATRFLPDLVAAVAVAVQSAVDASFADFKEQLNDMHPDPIMRLPVEVICDCFRPLQTLRERTAVSHVSRAWRRVALADKRMWAQATVSLGTRHNAKKLSVLLTRSQPLPFHLTWDADGAFPAVSDKIAQLVLQNMHRMQSLAIADVPSTIAHDIFACPAPILQSLSLNDDQHCCELPGRWGARLAPGLQVITVGYFKIPLEFEPLPFVRKFQGCLPALDDVDDLGLHNLFVMFPGITSLHLSDITAKSLSLLPTVPHSVTDILLEPDTDLVDFSSFIDNCIPTSVRRFQAHRADQVPATISAFTRKVRGPWSMNIDRSERRVALNDGDGAIRHELISLSAYWRRDGVPLVLQVCLDKLSSLTLPMRALTDFASARIVWDRSLPSLRSMSVTVDAGDDSHDSPVLLSNPDSVSPIRAPQLDELALEIHGLCGPDDAEYISITLPSVVPLLLSYSRPRLMVARVEVRWAAPLLKCDLSALARLASHVQIQEGFITVAELVDGELVSGTQLSPSL